MRMYDFSVLIPTFCEDIVQELFGLNIKHIDDNSSPLKYFGEELKRNKKLNSQMSQSRIS